MSEKKQIGRRELLKAGAIAGIGALLPIRSAVAALPPSGAPGVKRYAELGRTGIKMSDISFGSASLRSGQEDVVRHAFDRGINYFDSAEM